MHLAATVDGATIQGTDLSYVVIVAVIGLLALAAALTFRRQVRAAGEGTARTQATGRAVQARASAYPARQFKTLSFFVVVVLLLLLLLPADTTSIRIGRSVAFVVGALFSASIGYLGMSRAVRANVRVAAAARAAGRDEGMRIAFRTGGTVGMA